MVVIFYYFIRGDRTLFKHKKAVVGLGVIIAATACLTTGTMEEAIPPVDAPVVAFCQPEEKETPEIIMPEEIEEDEIPTYDIALSEELQLYTYELAELYDIEEYYPLLLSVMWVESRFKPDAIGGGANYGIMQINKVNHGWLSKELGVTDLLDAEQCILAGTHMLADYLHEYDANRALMVYNYGIGGAQGHWSRGSYSSAYSRKVLSTADELVDTGTITGGK
jgi:hypothetical protein